MNATRSAPKRMGDRHSTSTALLHCFMTSRHCVRYCSLRTWAQSAIAQTLLGHEFSLGLSEQYARGIFLHPLQKNVILLEMCSRNVQKLSLLL